jgi:hypothetical protein
MVVLVGEAVGFVGVHTEAVVDVSVARGAQVLPVLLRVVVETLRTVDSQTEGVNAGVHVIHVVRRVVLVRRSMHRLQGY